LAAASKPDTLPAALLRIIGANETILIARQID
jgi:hypothetical protein